MTNYEKYGIDLIEESEYISTSKPGNIKWKIILDVLSLPAVDTFEGAVDEIRRRLGDRDGFDEMSKVRK